VKYVPEDGHKLLSKHVEVLRNLYYTKYSYFIYTRWFYSHGEASVHGHEIFTRNNGKVKFDLHNLRLYGM